MISERPIRILVVDDDEEDYLMMRDFLSDVPNQEFVVEWAHSFDTGKTALISRDHDLCFLDYHLGPKTGIDLLKEAMAESVRTPVIVLTGYGQPAIDVEAMRIGAADYLVKNQIDSQLLERSIRYSIHRAQATQAILEREAQILMQDRLASVGLLASSLAHEIGTPLGVIRGRAEYLALQVKGDETIKKNVDIIISQIDRVSKLIKSLLNLARGNESRSTGAVDLGISLTDVLDLLAHEFRRNKIEIQSKWDDSKPLLVHAEAGPLHQVILNLLINSLHAIESGRKKRVESSDTITLSVEDLGHQLALRIQDTGCGISEKNMKNLFKPFFTTKDIGSGTGLGLATSYGIIESWGGTIEAKSEEGVGAEFTVILPKSPVRP